MTGLSRAHRIRQAANLLNGSTIAGLAIARFGRADVTPGPYGLLLAEHYRLAFPVAGAFTVGNVVLTPHTIQDLERTFPRVLDHEARHAWQYVFCGVLFLPLYVAAMGWSMLRTGDRAARNAFERWAKLADGGYEDVPIRPWREAVRRDMGRRRRRTQASTPTFDAER